MTSIEPVDLDTVVVIETAHFSSPGGTTIDGSGIEPSRVEGDPAALAEMVRNLVENAARHATTRVAVSVFPRGATIRLTVIDDGPGIPVAEWERVFERFARLDGSESPGGAGLGLTQVREVVTRHGGTTRVEPSTRGARLVVDLPRA